MRLAKRNLHETSSKVYTPDVLQRLSQIIGKSYTLAKQAKRTLIRIGLSQFLELMKKNIQDFIKERGNQL